jgi:hypothetical protein
MITTLSIPLLVEQLAPGVFISPVASNKHMEELCDEITQLF